MRHEWTHIIVHHSLTSDGLTVSWDAIRRYHTEVLGWSDVGYHFGIELMPSGGYTILAGRPLNRSGAHTRGMNERAIGFCLVGNYDEQEPPADMLIKSAEYIRGLMDLLEISPADVRAHRDYAEYKSCPGRRFDMSLFRDLLR